MNHVKNKISKKKVSEREMNGKKLIIQSAQNAKNVLSKNISQLFGLFLTFVIGTLYKITSFPNSSILFCSRGTNVFVFWLYKLDVTQVSKTFVNQIEKLKCDLTRVIKKV
jgi:hypothetical protein